MAVRFAATAQPGAALLFELWHGAAGKSHLCARSDQRDIVIPEMGYRNPRLEEMCEKLRPRR
jgi:hypothetical protein